MRVACAALAPIDDHDSEYLIGRQPEPGLIPGQAARNRSSGALREAAWGQASLQNEYHQIGFRLQLNISLTDATRGPVYT